MPGKLFGNHGSKFWNIDPIQLRTHFTCHNINMNYSNLDGENISHALCWADDFETINKPKPSCRFHGWCPCCRFHRRYKRVFFWLEGFRGKAPSKSIVTSKSSVHECWWEWIICAKHGFLFKRQRCNMAFIEPMHRNKPNITYFSSGN